MIFNVQPTHIYTEPSLILLIMKTVLTILAFTTIFSIPAFANNTQNDKALHFGSSVIIATISSTAFLEQNRAYTSCLAVGLAKEIVDQWDYGKFDLNDIAWDAFGCTIGAYVLPRIANFEIWKDHNQSTNIGISLTYRF